MTHTIALASSETPRDNRLGSAYCLLPDDVCGEIGDSQIRVSSIAINCNLMTFRRTQNWALMASRRIDASLSLP